MTPSRDQNNTGLSSQCSWQALTWKAYLLQGTLLLIIFYWAVPTWLNDELGTFQSSTARPIAASLLARRICWIELAGMILGFSSIFFAIRNYLTLQIISKKNRQRTRFSRLFTRGID